MVMLLLLLMLFEREILLKMSAKQLLIESQLYPSRLDKNAYIEKIKVKASKQTVTI